MSASKTCASGSADEGPLCTQLWLNHSFKAWEEAYHVFAKKRIKCSSQRLIRSHDVFAGHLLDVHRLKCRECYTGVLPPILPDKKALCADTGTQTEPEWKAPYRNPVVETESESHQENDSSGTITPFDRDANQTSCPLSVGTFWTENVYRVPILRRGPKGKFTRRKNGRKERKKRVYERKRPIQDEQGNRNAAPRAKTSKTSEPMTEPQTLGPRKSLRIKERIESQAEPLQDLIFTMPTTTTRDEEEDGWIEDGSNSTDGWIEDGSHSDCLEEFKQDGCMPSMSTSNLGYNNSKDADSQPATNYKTTSNLGPSNNRVADSQPATNYITTSNLGPSNSKDTDSPPATNSNISPWSSKLSPNTIPEFRGKSPGPSVELPTLRPEIVFFQLLFPPYLINHLVVETNYYVEQCLAVDGNLAQWSPTTLNEMGAFLGLQVLMSVWKLPDLSMYWSMDKSFGRIKVWEVMPQDRFEALSQYFQPYGSLKPEESAAGLVQESKGCTVLDIINESKGCTVLYIINEFCRLRYSPHRDCSVNEATIKLANEQKVNICLLVDSESGYCSKFQVCHPEKGAGEKQGVRDGIVLDLTQSLQKQHYIVNMSESFTSFELLKTLEAKGILGRGAVNNSQRNLVSLPRVLFNKSSCHNAILQQGNITACSWYNATSKRQVISSADDPKVVYTVQQKYNGILMNTKCPRAVVHYMKCMYSNPFRNPYPTQGRSRRKDPCIFWIAFDVAIANAHILKHGSGCTHKTMELFRKALSQQLIQCFMHQEAIHPSDLTSGLDKQSRLLHSDCTNDSIRISRVTGVLDMQSLPLHSDGSHGNVQPTHPLHLDSTSDNVQPARSKDDNGVQSNLLHSDSTNDIQFSKVTGGLGMQSHPLHSDCSDESIRISRVTGGLDMQSLPLHSDCKDDSIRISRVTSGLDMQSLPLHSDCTNDTLHPARSDDGIGMQSSSLQSRGSHEESAKPDPFQIAKRIKVEPND